MIISDTLSYGYAAFSEPGSCCKCYELTFTNTAVAGKKMIVQVYHKSITPHLLSPINTIILHHIIIKGNQHRRRCRTRSVWSADTRWWRRIVQRLSASMGSPCWRMGWSVQLPNFLLKNLENVDLFSFACIKSKVRRRTEQRRMLPASSPIAARLFLEIWLVFRSW